MKFSRFTFAVLTCVCIAAPTLSLKGQGDAALSDFIEIVNLREAEQLEDVVGACEKFVEKHPDSVGLPTVLFYGGKAAFEVKQYDSVVKSTAALIEKYSNFPQMTEVYMLRGEGYRLKGNWVAALPDFEIAFTRFEKEKNEEAAHALFHVIQGQQETGAVDEAKKSYDLLVANFSDSKYVGGAAKIVGATPLAPKPAAPKKEAAFSAGDEAPDFSFFQLDDNTEKSLADLKGQVVVVDFWASWCGPCQAPMAKMQTYGEAHPEWKDKVKLVALSIDNDAETAVAHLAKKGWDKTYNVWAGEGGFKAGAAVAYKIRGIPTACVIDQEGKIAAYGHPASMDISEIVGGLLK